LRLETIHPRALDGATEAAWRALQAADPALASPYLTPDWARLVGEARPDARLVLLREEGELRGVLGAQRTSRFAAMGLGAPIADYQGLIAPADLGVSPAALCKALNVGRIDLSHAPTSRSYFARAEQGKDGSWIVDTAMGLDAYRATQKERRGEAMRQLDKKLRKLTREHGAPVLCALSDNAAHFETMMGWKRAQLVRTGQPAIGMRLGCVRWLTAHSPRAARISAARSSP